MSFLRDFLRLYTNAELNQHTRNVTYAQYPKVTYSSGAIAIVLTLEILCDATRTLP